MTTETQSQSFPSLELGSSEGTGWILGLSRTVNKETRGKNADSIGRPTPPLTPDLGVPSTLEGDALSALVIEIRTEPDRPQGQAGDHPRVTRSGRRPTLRGGFDTTSEGDALSALVIEIRTEPDRPPEERTYSVFPLAPANWIRCKRW